MSSQSSFSKLMVWLFATALLSQSVRAQEAASKIPEEVIELSPFQVESSGDLGYLATSTLAGTRLNTSLKEIGAAVSVYTPEFLADINVAKIEDILTYTAGTEGGGINGNFSGMGTSENSAEVRDDPSGTNRVRGLAPATRTRDFFPSDIPSDGFSFDTVTVNRGPNAILAGVGNAGGIIDTAMRKATFKDNYRVVSRFGAHDSHREEVHINKVIIPNKLAVRLDLLSDNTFFRQQPAFAKDQRLYTALNYKVIQPKKGGVLGAGTLRANFETGRIEGIPPDPTTPTSMLDNWFNPTTRTTYDSTTGITTPGAEFPINAKYYWDPTFVNGTTRGAYFRQNGTQITGTAGQVGVGAGFPLYSQWALIFADPTATTAKVDPTGSIAALNGLQGFVGTVPLTLTPPVVLLGPGGALRGSGDIDRNRAGFFKDHLSNPAVFDFYNNLLTGALDSRSQRFNAADFRYEQLFWGGKVGAEIAYNRQSFTRYRNFAVANSGDEGIMIDVNKYLTIRDTANGTGTGILNPNFGRPFISSSDAFKDQQNRVDREAQQLTAFVRQDFTKGNSKWGWLLGDHTLSTLLFKTSIDRSNRTYVSTWDPAGQLSTVPIGEAGAFGSQVNAWFYLGDSLLGPEYTSVNDVRLQALTGSRPQYGDTYTLRVFEPSGNPAIAGSFVTGTSTPLRVLGRVLEQREDLFSSAVALQSKWLKNHIVTVVGWREDRDKNLTSGNPPYLPNGGLDESQISYVPSANEIKRSWTKSVVALVPYTFRGDSQIRLFWNQAGNFNPVGQRRNIWNEEVGSANADTREFGASLSAFHGKFELRFNRFRTRIKNDSVSIINPYNYISSMITRMINARDQGLLPYNWGFRYSSTVPVGSITLANNEWQSFNDVALAFYNTIPDRLKANIGPAFNFDPHFSGSGSTLQWNPDKIVNYASLTDSVSTGTEFEATVNPVRGWRISMSAAMNQAVRSRVAVEELALAQAWIDNLDKMYVNYVSSGSPTVGRLHFGSRQPGAAVVPTGKFDGNSIFSQYNNETYALIKGQNALSDSPTPELRKWRFNLITRYEFQTGRLRGFSLGGTLRWQDRVAIGFPSTQQTVDGIPNVWVSDFTKPYWGPTDTAVDVSFGYKRKIKVSGKPISWNIGLNVRNLNAKDQLIPIGANPDGTIGTFRIPPERGWSVTNSFSF